MRGFATAHLHPHTVYKDSPSADSVVVFDEKGKFVRSFGPMFRGGAHGMHLSKEGKTEYLYFCDEKHGIITKRTLKGEEIWTMGYPQDSPPYTKAPGMPGLNYRPTNFAIAPNLDFWVGDGYGSYYMFHYSQASSTAYPKLVRTFGGPPAGQAQGGGRGRGDGAAAAPGGAWRASGGRRASRRWRRTRRERRRRARTCATTRSRSTRRSSRRSHRIHEQSARQHGRSAGTCKSHSAGGRSRQQSHRAL